MKKIELEKRNDRSQTSNKWRKHAWINVVWGSLAAPGAILYPLTSAIISFGSAGIVRIAYNNFIFLHTMKRERDPKIHSMSCQVFMKCYALYCSHVFAVTVIKFQLNVMCKSVRMKRNDRYLFREVMSAVKKCNRLTCQKGSGGKRSTLG